MERITDARGTGTNTRTANWVIGTHCLPMHTPVAPIEHRWIAGPTYTPELSNTDTERQIIATVTNGVQRWWGMHGTQPQLKHREPAYMSTRIYAPRYNKARDKFSNMTNVCWNPWTRQIVNIWFRLWMICFDAIIFIHRKTRAKLWTFFESWCRLYLNYCSIS